MRPWGLVVVLLAGCADLSPDVGCLEAEVGSGTHCPPDAMMVDAAPDGGVGADGGADANLETGLPVESGKFEAGRNEAGRARD